MCEPSLRRATEMVLDAVRNAGAPNPIVLVDGRSGAGKSTLARALVARWPAPHSVQLIALDDLYPGWDGLDAGSETIRSGVLEPLRSGRSGFWRRYDWETACLAETRAVSADLPLIVEGSGVLTRESRSLCDVAVWAEAPDEIRRARALARDGDTYRPHWERWARQEDEHVLRDDPAALASIVLSLA